MKATEKMSLTVNLYYHGQNGSARKFAEEMKASGVAQAIREEASNLRYEYFQPLADPETILLIDSWEKARRRWTSTTLHR
ncbi:Antibiotic biosynthesis monooxygenase [Ligilactobacillus sp. WC1T17]|uniref:Antibiotic biosynthesis monooxygenase n=1 Tax=Ligilactobacillus ruminis TaxID=1623 RepID=A0ABY1AB37_9LACO|nr:Antibiotic biosynthesis monooxygenase [Ligilactobacillus ruminis]